MPTKTTSKTTSGLQVKLYMMRGALFFAFVFGCFMTFIFEAVHKGKIAPFSRISIQILRILATFSTFACLFLAAPHILLFIVRRLGMFAINLILLITIPALILLMIGAMLGNRLKKYILSKDPDNEFLKKQLNWIFGS